MEISPDNKYILVTMAKKGSQINKIKINSYLD
jgi:hypothetical protein